MMRKNDAYLEDDICEDGESVRVPVYLMDATQRAVAGVDLSDHQPGYLRVTDAAVRDARTAACDARDAMIKRATEAWRTAGRVQSKQDADPTEPDPSAASAVEQELERWQGRDLADLGRAVEAKRRAIHREFSERLSSAWRIGR